jgi:heat shock protein HslJ
MNFIPDRIGAKFGCNSLGAGYSVAGSVLTAGAIMATRMACPDMSFETQGSAIMALPMTIAGGANRMVLSLSNRNGTIELVRSDHATRF